MSAKTAIKVEVQTETEQPRGWVYSILMHHGDGSVTHHTVSLSWFDHELWSGGRLPPSQVLEAALNYAVNQDPRSAANLTHATAPQSRFPARFDAARLRRMFPRIDQDLRREP